MGRPNVLILLMDSCRVDNLSCYGNPRMPSPNLNRLAKDGIVFLNNFAPGAWTPPAHASLITGRYVSGHMILNAEWRSTFSEIPTMAEALNGLGYRTAAFTCNDLVNDKEGGILRGFREVMHPGKSKTPYDDKIKETIAAEMGDAAGKGERDKGSSYIAYLFKEWLKDNYDGRSPFFIFINYVETHHPYWPPQPFRGHFLPP